MNPLLRSILLKATKNAVNAALLTLAPVWQDAEHYNWHNIGGLKHLGVLILWAAITREIMVWGPKILKWSQTNDNGGTMKIILFLLTALLFAVPAAAQAPPAPQPNDGVHFSFAATYTNFRNPDQTATSIEARLPFTPRISLLYQQILVPTDANLTFYFGKVRYTWPGRSVLRFKNLQFDPDKLEFFAQAGLGSINQTQKIERIAETVGVGINVKTSDNVSLRLFSVDYVNGGIQHGILSIPQHLQLGAGVELKF